MNPFQNLRDRLDKETPSWADRNILLVALGDSVTQGLGLNPRMLGMAVYHEVFRRSLIARYPERSFSLVNAGVGGDSTPGALARLQRDVLDHRPHLVTVCLGLNDSGRGRDGEGKFRANLMRIVEQIRATAAVILLTPNMMAAHDNPRVDPAYRQRIGDFVTHQTGGGLERYCEVIREVAAATSTPLADCYAEWIRRNDAGEDMTLWLANGINHPDERGHQLMAEVLERTFVRAIEQAGDV